MERANVQEMPHITTATTFSSAILSLIEKLKEAEFNVSKDSLKIPNLIKPTHFPPLAFFAKVFQLF